MCSECDFAEEPVEDRLGCVLYIDNATKSKSTAGWLASLKHKLSGKCPDCFSDLSYSIYFTNPPSILMFDQSNSEIYPSRHFKLVLDDENEVKFKLKGLVYHGGFHFTCRIINDQGDIWYNDGIDLGRDVLIEGNVKEKSNKWWQTCKERKLVLSIYEKY